MKRVRYGFYSLLFVLSLITSMIVPSGIASATSDYDDLLQVSPTLYVYTDGSAKTQKMDISQTWWAEFKQTYAKRVAQNIGWPTNFVTEFEDIVASGGSWGVYMEETVHGNMVTIIGTRDPNAYCTFVGPASSGWYECITNPGYGFVRAGYFTHNSYGGNGCIGSFGDRCSDTGMNAYETPDVRFGSVSYTVFASYNTSLSNYQFFVMNFDLTYPGGYEGELVPAEPPAAMHVAMGDSYASGEGNSPFVAGTDVNNENGCHRSPQAYPRLLQSRLGLGPTAFVACSSATTTNITESGQWNEPPQVDAITDETEIVTLTIGGNDVGFSDYAMACNVTCGPGTTAYNTIMGKINDPDFKDSLVSTYEAILTARPNADLDLYVADYPYLAAEDATMCWGLDFSGAYEVQEALNEVIFDAVVEVGLNSNHIFMVQTNYPGSPFEGGHLCNGGDPLFHGIVFYPDLEYSLHPDADGQAAYADVFEEAIG